KKLCYINNKINNNNLSIEEFDLIGLKYLNKLFDFYKDNINKLKINKETLTILNNIKLINTSFTIFYRYFNLIFQNYNDKHKAKLKNFPNTIKIYFKLLEDNF